MIIGPVLLVPLVVAVYLGVFVVGRKVWRFLGRTR